MQTAINLQEPFSYSIIPWSIAVFLFVVVTYYCKHSKKTKEKAKVEQTEMKRISEKNIKNVPVIKSKYLKQLDAIEHQYVSQTLALRKAYQSISETMRMFVFEMTDITTQNYSLEEIKKLNLPILYELIEEYYEPEFASKSLGDFGNAVNKARLIKERSIQMGKKLPIQNILKKQNIIKQK